MKLPAEALRHDAGAAIWPRGCKDTESCGDRHRACMYFGCRHRGKDIRAAIDAEIERLDEARTAAKAAL